MNINQLNQIKGKIEEFENSKYEKGILEFLEESQSMIDIYSPEEYVATIKRVIKQLKIELEDEKGFNYFPYQYNFGNEFGSGNLLSDMQHLLNHINKNQFTNTIGYLKRLIYYQVVNGFWDKSKRKLHKSNEIKLTEANDRIEFLEERLKRILNKLEKEKEEFGEYVQEKKIELIKIDNNLESAKLSVSQINTLLDQSTENKNEIDTILKTQNSEIEENKGHILSEKEQIENIRIGIKTLKKTIEQKIIEFEEKDSSFKEKLEFVESKKGYFDERLEYLEELIGREVGASLFETFKQRKKELNDSVNFWKFSVPIMTVAIIIWIYFLFNISIQNSDEATNIIHKINWEEYLVNTLKLIPAIILLFFTIRQYKKERNFQEEYAFKSAVALTIDAYSKKISSSEKRDDMIMNSVANIYQTPINTKRSKESINTKSMLKGIEAVKGTVSDVAKNVIQISKEIK